MAIRFSAMRSIAPAVRPVMHPGQYCAPDGARKPYGLQGNGLPHQRARWFAMTDLEVRWVWRQVRRFRQASGGGKTPALRVHGRGRVHCRYPVP